MSSEAAVATGAEGAGGAKSGKMKWIIIAVAVMAVGGGGAFFLLGRHKAEGGPAKEEAKKEHAAAQYLKFEPAFVVNFGGEGNSRYLQITVEVMSRSAEALETVKSNEPAIRNDLVLLYSSQQYDVLMTAEGKDKLRQDTLESIRKVAAHEGAKAEEIENVYFTSFVIQ